MGYPVPFVKAQWFDENGDPLAGGLLYTFEGGTDTPLPTYTTAALNVENSNPVELDAEGRANVFVPAGIPYKFVMHDAADVELWSVDSVEVPEPEAPPAPIVVPPGAILAYGGSSAPDGYLMCDGSAVSRTTFADLFDVIGTTYGAGDGSSTFNVPDLRQRFPLGKGAAGTGSSLGSSGGDIDHVHTGPEHAHAAGELVTGAPSATAEGQAGTGFTVASSTHTHEVTGDTADAGTGDTGSANPPFLVVNYVIRAE